MKIKGLLSANEWLLIVLNTPLRILLLSIAGILLITGCLMSGEYVMTENDILGKRMVPVFMILGQSAGIIACMTNQSGPIFACPAWRNSFANHCITNLFVIYL